MLFRGVIPALITPFDEHGQIYWQGLESVLDFELGRGVHGLFILGTAGEGPMLAPDERKQVARFVLKHVQGRVPVIVHVGTMPSVLACDLASDAAQAGAAAVSAIPPTYYRHDFAGIQAYYASIAGATGLPLFIYNNPTATGTALSGDQIKQLAQIPTLKGLKDSSGSVPLLYEALENPGFTVLIGNTDLNLLALSMGAAGSVSTIAVVVPELFVRMQDKLNAGDLRGAVAEQKRMTRVARPLRIPAIGALHAALRLRGVDAGYPRPPLRLPTTQEIERITMALAEAELS